MNKLFETLDLEYDRRCLKAHFFSDLLPDDFARRDEEEDAASEARPSRT